MDQSSSGESLTSKTYLPYLPYEPDQQLLLPAALQEWLPDDHQAYFISYVVDQLDMSEVPARSERERRGEPPYHPPMMVKALLYGYCVGVASSRRIAQCLHEDIAFRVLPANNTPDFQTISNFRKDCKLSAIVEHFRSCHKGSCGAHLSSPACQGQRLMQRERPETHRISWETP